MKLLRPIRITTEDYDRLEAKIIAEFQNLFYKPLKVKYKNAAPSGLMEALREGGVYYADGAFRGKFNASISRELKKLGAKWDRGVFRISERSLPYDVSQAIAASFDRWNERMAAIEDHIRQIDPEAFQIEMTSIFDTALYKVEADFQKSISGLTIAPKLSAKERLFIAREWQNNMGLYIKSFVADEKASVEQQIKELRKKVAESTYAGDRYESLTGIISASYGVTQRKAKFLARQETNLLMAKYKETRYASAGVTKYIWQTVVGTPKHPVRPMHAALRGSKQKFAQPPITDEKGNRNNPGEDYNCRCYARPILPAKAALLSALES